MARAVVAERGVVVVDVMCSLNPGLQTDTADTGGKDGHDHDVAVALLTVGE